LFIVNNVYLKGPRLPGADPFAAIGAQLVAWKRVDGRWHFYEDALDYGSDRHFYPPAARRATTTEEILGLMSVGFLPDTSTETPRHTDAEPWQAPLLIMVFLVSLVAMVHPARVRINGGGHPRARSGRG
jgi:hypothetical protein